MLVVIYNLNASFYYYLANVSLALLNDKSTIMSFWEHIIDLRIHQLFYHPGTGKAFWHEIY